MAGSHSERAGSPLPFQDDRDTIWQSTHKSSKAVRPPTITPRRFKKFFTPVSISKTRGSVRTSRRALQIISNPPGKRTPSASQIEIKRRVQESHLDENKNELRPNKRKISTVLLEDAQLQSGPIQEPFFLPSSQDPWEGTFSARNSPPPVTPYEEKFDHYEDVECWKNVSSSASDRRSAVRRAGNIGQNSNRLFRRISASPRRPPFTHASSLRNDVGDFYSGADDVYFCGSQPYNHPVLPFSTASCRTNSLVAVGDEEGGIRLLESSPTSQPAFAHTFLTFKAHENAIMDLEFSEDDLYLATGAGDQTCRIIDMAAQKPLHTLSGHSSSIKRVHFQPGGNNRILTSCSRDGTINIWDLRIGNGHRPSERLSCTSSDLATATSDLPADAPRDSIRGAHPDDRHAHNASSKPKAARRREGASVTSLVFLGNGREHLLATSSEANAAIKLWDMRMSYDGRGFRPLPVSTTQRPSSHQTHRQFGLTSMALSTDHARLYALCRDHTVYTYSTSHLILGHAPELTLGSMRARRAGGAERQGLGPLYGFRHPRLETSTFYTKLSVRPQKDDQREILAAGSGTGDAVLFSTDERSFRHRSTGLGSASPISSPAPTRCHVQSSISSPAEVAATTPIHQHGTALIRGHRKEVTSSTWTTGGYLVTISDDFNVRRWREGVGAQELRAAGEAEGKRWMSGWADVDPSLDNDEDDDETRTMVVVNEGLVRTR